MTNGEVPKHDYYTEQALLGAMIIDPDIIPDVVAQLTSSYFYADMHQYLFKAIAFLYSQKIPIDLITVKAQLEKFKVLEMIGGITYLAELIDATQYTSNYIAYINIIKECYQYRVIRRIAGTIESEITKGTPPLDIINSLDSLTKEVLTNTTSNDLKHIGELMQNRYETLADSIENKENILRDTVYTGYTQLDKQLGGLHKGNFCIVAARPAMGKTTFALNITDYVLRSKKKVAFFSLEMSETEITDRLISIYSRVNGFRLRVGMITEQDLNSIGESCERLMDMGLYVDASTNLTPGLLKSKLLKLTSREKIDLVIVDYLQLMKEPAEKNRTQEIGEISRQLKVIAKEFNIPVIALSQLSRALETRPSKIPIMSDLRDSGGIEQDADQIIFLYREEVYDEFTDKINIVDVLLKKNRHGATGNVQLHFDKSKQRMYNRTEQGNIIDPDMVQQTL